MANLFLIESCTVYFRDSRDKLFKSSIRKYEKYTFLTTNHYLPKTMPL